MQRLFGAMIVAVVMGCGGGRPDAPTAFVDAEAATADAAIADAAIADAAIADATTADATIADATTADAATPDVASDGFERAMLGSSWTIVYPNPLSNDQVRIVDSSDLGMGPGSQGFFLANWTQRAFTADQFCEATTPVDATPGWAYQVYVRWRASDAARYGFGYDNDPSQPNYGDWIFKYDGVPGPQTRIIASTAAVVVPQPGDTIRLEVEAYTLRGYLNGTLVLQATDTDPTKIPSGAPGLAARWAIGNQSTTVAARVWESWAGGSL